MSSSFASRHHAHRRHRPHLLEFAVNLFEPVGRERFSEAYADLPSGFIGGVLLAAGLHCYS